ncbi:MAG: hypothetical protein ABID09_03015 [Candidatus Omnitrophota bacterium]
MLKLTGMKGVNFSCYIIGIADEIYKNVKEVRKMIKRILSTIIIGMIAIGFNVVPAEAYTVLNNEAARVTISATGNLTGNTETFSVAVVTKLTGAGASLVFEAPSGIANSGEALKIKGGTNELDARIIVYTDNDILAADPRYAGDQSTGIDGGGLVGETNKKISVALLWGVETTEAAGIAGPNQNVDYTFDGNTDDGVGEVYIVDKSHSHSFVPTTDPGLDTVNLYKNDGTQLANPANEGPQGEGLYPQLWDEPLYDAPTAPKTIIVPSLYSTIATLAFGLGYDGTDYLATVADISTAITTDSVLAKVGPGVSDPSLYYYIAGDFRGKPAQTYTTNQLNVAMTKD